MTQRMSLPVMMLKINHIAGTETFVLKTPALSIRQNKGQLRKIKFCLNWSYFTKSISFKINKKIIKKKLKKNFIVIFTSKLNKLENRTQRELNRENIDKCSGHKDPAFLQRLFQCSNLLIFTVYYKDHSCAGVVFLCLFTFKYFFSTKINQYTCSGLKLLHWWIFIFDHIYSCSKNTFRCVLLWLARITKWNSYSNKL